MTDFRSSVTIFWSESAAFIAIYAAFALIVCIVTAGLELHGQSSAAPIARVATKGAASLGLAIVMFTLALYLSGWHPLLFGSELATMLGTAIIWFGAACALNWTLSSHLMPSVFIWLPAAALVLPYLTLGLFAIAVGSAWKN